MRKEVRAVRQNLLRTPKALVQDDQRSAPLVKDRLDLRVQRQVPGPSSVWLTSPSTVNLALGNSRLSTSYVQRRMVLRLVDDDLADVAILHAMDAQRQIRDGGRIVARHHMGVQIFPGKGEDLLDVRGQLNALGQAGKRLRRRR